ncbi:MAG: helix-turn-helix domain-containing protein [Dehalococcoidia bacterium]
MAKLERQGIPSVMRDGSKLMTVNEVAEKLGVHHETVRRWIRSKPYALKARRYRTTDRRVRVRIASDKLNAWLARSDD